MTSGRFPVGLLLVAVAFGAVVAASVGVTAYAIRPVPTTLPAVATPSVADLTGPGAVNRRSFVARVPVTWDVTQTTYGFSANDPDGGIVSLTSYRGEREAVCAEQSSYASPPPDATREAVLSFDGSDSIGRRWTKDSTQISIWCFSRGVDTWVANAYYQASDDAALHAAMAGLASSWRWR